MSHNQTVNSNRIMIMIVLMLLIIITGVNTGI